MNGVSFSRLARRELDEAVDFLESRSKGAGLRLAEAVRAALLLLRNHPRVGRRLTETARRFPVGGFPYQLIYRPLDDGRIRVLAVAHKRRRPRYWFGRD
jgi:plasmid stabilization system protein ParE